MKIKAFIAALPLVCLGSNLRLETAAGGEAFEVTDEHRSFWSFQPIERPQVPDADDGWARQPVDAFVLRKLKAAGLAPSSSAKKRELIRRLYFDVIGLPPGSEEVDAFVADESPGAYERRVDDLLARPQYGERWGRHWLDIVRYAQTNGYERDDEKPNAWRYRDYVIQSLNEDKPYNRFVLEQLAGDELADVTHDSIVATGFYRLGAWDDEPDDKVLAVWEELDDIVQTTAETFLGLTIGCARCHNHKFDAIICTDDHAYNFILERSHDLFPKTPIVFFRVDEILLIFSSNLYFSSIIFFSFKFILSIANSRESIFLFNSKIL